MKMTFPHPLILKSTKRYSSINAKNYCSLYPYTRSGTVFRTLRFLLSFIHTVDLTEQMRGKKGGKKISNSEYR